MHLVTFRDYTFFIMLFLLEILSSTFFKEAEWVDTYYMCMHACENVDF
jgi:hypothetical protein